ncbi:S1C family serine protease [Pilimelia columellifera]|uniref:PDZ domain-containing protein n=1 Tax=Pilimelia columellifera subsp. columellifera TaxID=706583 RepID=A0ABP6AFC8_9ACTN
MTDYDNAREPVHSDDAADRAPDHRSLAGRGADAPAGSGAPVTSAYPAVAQPAPQSPDRSAVPAGYGAAPYGQGGGQPAYGQPAYDQSAYGQSAHGQGGADASAGRPTYGPPANPYGAGAPTTAGYGQHDAYQPPWTAPTGALPTSAAQGAGNRGGGKVGKAIGLGAAAVVLSLCSGLVGAFVATGMDDDVVTLDRGFVSQDAAPVLDRGSLAGIATTVSPSVVSIGAGNGEGSGVLISADGFLVTNNHVVESAPGGQVTVFFKDGRSGRGKVIGTDPRTDLAVVKVDGLSGLKPATFGSSSAMQVGDTVLAIGSPLGLQGSVTAGIVSQTDRTISVGGEAPEGGARSSLSGLFQTDAPINPGNSGGALVNLKGEVIGINTAIATAGSQGNIGVGFAIPSDRVKRVADALKAGEKVTHPYLGVRLEAAESGGALVILVEPGSPADKAGIKRGDVITELGGRKITKQDDLISAVQSGKPNDKLNLTYTRNGSPAKATVTLGEN